MSLFVRCGNAARSTAAPKEKKRWEKEKERRMEQKNKRIGFLVPSFGQIFVQLSVQLEEEVEEEEEEEGGSKVGFFMT